MCVSAARHWNFITHTHTHWITCIFQTKLSDEGSYESHELTSASFILWLPPLPSPLARPHLSWYNWALLLASSFPGLSLPSFPPSLFTFSWYFLFRYLLPAPSLPSFPSSSPPLSAHLSDPLTSPPASALYTSSACYPSISLSRHLFLAVLKLLLVLASSFLSVHLSLALSKIYLRVLSLPYLLTFLPSYLTRFFVLLTHQLLQGCISSFFFKSNCGVNLNKKKQLQTSFPFVSFLLSSPLSVYNVLKFDERWWKILFPGQLNKSYFASDALSVL